VFIDLLFCLIKDEDLLLKRCSWLFV